MDKRQKQEIVEEAGRLMIMLDSRLITKKEIQHQAELIKDLAVQL